MKVKITMCNIDIRYKSFCWVIGTTSFRTAKLNLKIEEQLILLDDFHNEVSKNNNWTWNRETQSKYYDFMKESGFLYGNVTYKDKDAREKTSGLVDIGLISRDRKLTPAGRELLAITKEGDFEKNNIFNIDNDSFVYLKQLLKTTINVAENKVRPFSVTIKSLIDLGYLSQDEFTYFIPLIYDEETYGEIINDIKLFRKNKISIEDSIFNRLISMDNYKSAYDVFMENEISEDLICLIGINRKSRKYDKIYYRLYLELENMILNNKKNYSALYECVKKIRHRPGTLWKDLIFATNNKRLIKKNDELAIKENCPFIKCKTKEELKHLFFKYLHVHKAMATLSDYFDLNRRYFKLSEIMIFTKNKIELDILPKYFFTETINNDFDEIFIENHDLKKSISLKEISRTFDINMDIIYEKISRDTGIRIETANQAKVYIQNERYRRFNELIDIKFSDDTLLELLVFFKDRNDKKIEEIVTEEATIPTIFEYILGIIWYKISERQGDILEFMKLSLGSDLLPKTHANGGLADIIYEYDACSFYPEHSLLIEATLSDGVNQRRMEMEPVSRHLGDYRIKSENPYDYSLFISTYLDKNVVNDFRFRKIMPYTKNDETIVGMKIISIDTDSLSKIIMNKTKYKTLYKIFDKYYELPLDSDNWHTNLVEEVQSNYEII